MPQSWEQHVRSQEQPDVCPFRKPNGDLCGNPSHASSKVAPFCHYVHRNEHVRYLKKLDEDKLVAACAQKGELVDREGAHCFVTHVWTDELRDEKKQKGHRYKSGRYESKWKTACGEVLEYPKAIKATNVTCLGCLAVDLRFRS